MNNIPNSNNEILLIKFLGTYQYIDIRDVKLFFSSKKYYRTRITNLIKNKFLKKIDNHLILDINGRLYLNSIGYKNNRLNRHLNYRQRVYYISRYAAFYHNSKYVKFTPSYYLKDNINLTTSARRFIGVTSINGIDYLTYYISINHDNRYIGSVIYDIGKEKTYKNILILTDNKVKLNYSDFIFGFNQVLILEDTIENRTKLQYIHCIDWHKIIEKEFKNPFISAYNFCDYEDLKGRYISYFTLYDTEKINRINHFLSQNKFKKVDILCSKDIADKLKQVIPRANYTVLDLEKYIDRKRFCYE